MPDSELPVYNVRTTNEHLPVGTVESCITTAPAGLYVSLGDGPPALHLRALGRLLRDICTAAEEAAGKLLHHSEWVITDDPAVVEQRGMHGTPECVKCRSDVDQALAHLAEHRQALLVGKLYWAQEQTNG